MNDFAIKLGSAAAESFIKEAISAKFVSNAVHAAKATPKRLIKFQKNMADAGSRELDKAIQTAQTVKPIHGGIHNKANWHAERANVRGRGAEEAKRRLLGLSASKK